MKCKLIYQPFSGTIKKSSEKTFSLSEKKEREDSIREAYGTLSFFLFLFVHIAENLTCLKEISKRRYHSYCRNV